MALPTAGLQTSIWNNNLKSVALLALYPVVLALVIVAVCAVYGFYSGAALSFTHSGVMPTWAAAGHYSLFVTHKYWPILLTVVSVWFMIAYLFQGSMVRSLSRSHPVSRREEPQLYNLVENLTIAQGMTMPRLEIIETHARNAFASGVNDGTFCVTVTRGLMQSLAKDELEAVLAHELTHIRNRDVRLMMVCVIFTGMFGVAAQILWSSVRYRLWIPSSHRRYQGSALPLLVAVMAVLGLGYLATMLARLALSRRREFMADAGAVQMTKNPEAMMRALRRIAGAADIPAAPGDVRTMCFENARPFMGLFATHPPIEKRISAIASYSGLPAPEFPARQAVARAEAFAAPSAGQRDNWTTRQRFKARRNPDPWGK